MESARKLKNIAIVANFNIEEKLKASMSVAEKLIELGCNISAPARGFERIEAKYPDKIEKISFYPFDKLYKNVDAVVVLGGDGTILETARHAASSGTPVLGMNLGRLGYLAELEANEIDTFEKIVNGEYSLDERSMLKVSIKSVRKGKINCGYALNDAVITNAGFAKVIDLVLYDRDTEIAAYRADGIIVSTPTGSTAYSMAAGGAVVDPRLRCFCITPICSHSLTSKPLIFPDCAEIEVLNSGKREKKVILTLDGRQTFDMYYGDKACVSKSQITAKFIRVKPRSFYKTLRNKLNACDKTFEPIKDSNDFINKSEHKESEVQSI